MITEKYCKGCEKILPIENFRKSKMTKDGYENKCKTCRKEQSQKYINVCKICGKEFKTQNKDAKFCSPKCVSDFKNKDNRVKINCSYCSKEITRPKSLAKFTNIYCNSECKALHQKEIRAGKNSPSYNRIEYCCDGCGKIIEVIPSRIKKQKYIFCSKECYQNNIGKYFSGKNNHNYKRVLCECYYCGKEFERKPSEIEGNRTFCSHECYMEVNKNKPRKAIINVNCEVCGKEIEIWRSKMKQVKNHYCSTKCSNIGFSRLYRGENSPCYNPELTDFEREKARHTPEYNDWRKAVYERDNYTCQCCGDDKGGNLRAHHYYNYSEHKELRYDVNNGVTLCELCHVSFHNTYGYKNNTKEQFEEYLKTISMQ